MRYIFISLLVLMAFTNTNKNHGNYYENKSFVKLSEPILDCFDDTPVVRCLRSMVVGGQNGGFWRQISGPQNMAPLLVGDNPCWEWSTVACGQYTFRYYVQTTCCVDSTTIRPRKCCSTVQITCN